MMQTMRNSAKIIFFIVLVTFVGFMAYGGVVSLLSGKSRMGGGAPPGVIGKVNDMQISQLVFEETYRQRLRNLSTDEHEPTDAEMEQARNDIWNTLTTMTLLEQEAHNHGIAITDREIADYMRQAPPKEVYESPDFATNGQFDLAKYQTWLQQLAISSDPRARNMLADFDNQIRQQLLRARIQDFVLSTVKVSEIDARNDYFEKNDKMKVQYFFIPGGDYDSTITTVSEDEIEARYEKDKEQLKQPEMAVINYVQIQKAPSESDVAEANEEISRIYEQARSGEDFAALAMQVSQDPGSAEKGGDLGWFGEGRMVAEFWDATKKLQKIGDITEPFKSQFGWHIIKLTGKRTAKGDDGLEKPEYQASHILIKTEPSSETLAQIELKATNLRNDAEKLGFKEAAEDYGLTLTESKPFAKGNQVPGVGQNQSLNDFAFEGKIGEMSDVVPGRSAFFVCQINRRTPAGFTPYAEARERIEKQVLREKRVEMAHKRGEELITQHAKGRSFEDIAAMAGKQIQDSEYFNRFQFIPKIGSDPDFAGAAFRLSPSNPISKSVNARTGAYIMKYSDRQNPDTSAFAGMSDSLTTKMIQTKQNDTWTKWLNDIKQKAKIEDYRSFYYGS